MRSGCIPAKSKLRPLPLLLLASILLGQRIVGNPSLLPLTNDAAVLAPGISLEQRRYLLYLYARVNNAQMADALARQILKDNPGDKQTLLVLASMYLERKEAAKALEAAETLVRYFPNDHQAIYFLGAAYYVAGQYAKSKETLLNLKLKQFQGKRYPYETDLASAALQAGDWYKAMLSYQTLLREHSMSEDLRLRDRQVLERIYREHLPEFTMSENGFLLRNGLVYRSMVQHGQQLTEKHRIVLQYSRQDVRVDEAPNLVSRWSNTDDVQVGLESVFDRRWKTSLWAGGTQSGARGSFSITRAFGGQRFFELRFDGNERSEDGLLLESLDGRQNRLTASVEYGLTHNWSVRGRAYIRQLVLAHQELGLSQGGTLQLERVLSHEAPDVRIGYHVTWMNYSGRNSDISLVSPAVTSAATVGVRRDILQNLVLSDFHRQGIYAEYRGHLSSRFFYHAGLSLDYDVLRSSIENTASAGFSLFPRKSIELRGDTVYSSSANTVDQGSDVWQFIIALNYWF